MTRIKIVQSTKCYFGIGGEAPWSAQYEFITDPACEDYDWLVVFDEFDAPETLHCPRERTILCTWEPVSIKSYSRAYTRQFGHLLSNRPPAAERHPHYHLGRGYFHWFLGRTWCGAAATHPEKTAELSLVCSVKKMKRTLHYDRFRLCEEIKRSVPGTMWFGSGLKPVLYKYEALDAFRYHVAIENHLAPGHWTEKLSDPILSECLPFYAGDPSIGEVLPPEAVIPIPMDDPAAAVRIIRSALAGGEYAKRLPAVLEAKRLILEKYNFWCQVIAVIAAESSQPVTPPDPEHPVVIWPRTELRRHSIGAALEDAWSHIRHLR